MEIIRSFLYKLTTSEGMMENFQKLRTEATVIYTYLCTTFDFIQFHQNFM